MRPIGWLHPYSPPASFWPHPVPKPQSITDIVIGPRSSVAYNKGNSARRGIELRADTDTLDEHGCAEAIRCLIGVVPELAPPADADGRTLRVAVPLHTPDLMTHEAALWRLNERLQVSA